jgi:hypothetical protein
MNEDAAFFTEGVIDATKAEIFDTFADGGKLAARWGHVVVPANEQNLDRLGRLLADGRIRDLARKEERNAERSKDRPVPVV